MKPKVAFYWCASCGGCDEAVLDLGADILDLVAAVDIVFWPVALDFKVSDVEAMRDGSIDIAFINGSVRSTEQAAMARLMRQKSKHVVAFGACAQLGGIPALSNLTTTAATLREVYGDAGPPLENHRANGDFLQLPQLFDIVLPLDRVIPVDYFVPGCPPSPAIISAAFKSLLSENPPQPGTVLAPDHCLCEECPRSDTRSEDLALTGIHRMQDTALDLNTCILAQGLPCLGASTRAGCGARCINGNMPCTGCFGPTSPVRDYGAKALCGIASILSATDELEIDRTLDGIADPAGLFYRYSLASSFLEPRPGE